jgi:arylsulfatase A-like enzyme
MKQFFFLLFLGYCFSVMAQDTPNVILIMTDDQGYGDITSHGNLKIKTSNMDRIASEGARLDNFFVSSVCAPTRASLLTGRYHIRTGVVNVTGNQDVMRAEELTIAEVFKQNGYKTACFGKWHNGKHYPNVPNGQGFDEFFGFCGGHFPNYFNATLQHNGRDVETDGFITDVLTDKALEWITENKDDPFFCYIPYNAPHKPFQVPDKYFNKYAEKGFDIKTATIYGMIENLDDNIGRITDAMSELGLDENTILVFLTDNGPSTAHRYNAGMKGSKTHVDEGGVRVPFFIRWKDHIPAGLQSSQISAHIDILPTLADLCNITLPGDLKIDGVSLKNYVLNEQEPFFERMIFSHMYFGGKLQPKKGAVRTQQYRYVLNPDEEGLYDMMNDPGQEVDLRDQQTEQFETLRKAYLAWFEEVTEGWKLETVIPCGYNESPLSYLSVVDAHLTGELHYHGRGYVNDWAVNWVNSNDSIIWDVNFTNSGRYKLTLEYVCPKDDVGSQVELSVGDNSLKADIDAAFNEPLYPSHDRAPRAGELQKPWGKMELGTLKVKKGQTKIVLSANSMKGSQVIEVNGIIIEKIN